MADRTRITLWLLAATMVLFARLAHNLKAEEKFKFGTWPYNVPDDSADCRAFLDIIKDTLRMNYLVTSIESETERDLLESEGIRCAVHNKSEPQDICVPYYYSCAHYNIWEAEGGQVYFESDSLKHSIGRAVQDGDVGAWMVSPDHADTAGIIQTGPLYGQDLKFIGIHDQDEWRTFDYFVPFRIRAGADTTAGDQNVAILSVTKKRGQSLYIVVCDTLQDSDFSDTAYFEDTLTYNTQFFYDSGLYDPKDKRTYLIEYRVYWFGNRDFYIDKVKVFDEDGQRLMAGEHDSRITDYVNTHYELSPAVDSWYLREEMNPRGRIDGYLPWRHVDSVLTSVDRQKRGFAAQSGIPFIRRVVPRDIHPDLYPLKGAYRDQRAIAHVTDSPTGDSLSLQEAWSNLTEALFLNRTESQDVGIGFSVTLQAFSQYECTASVRTNCPGNPDKWAYRWRMPTTQELRCKTNLSLAYGTEGVLYWKYGDGEYVDSLDIHWKTINGLTDTSANPTENWYYIRDVVGPFMENMGETFYNLKWQGAGLCDTASLIPNSFIDSVKSNEYALDSIFAEVGFFKDDADTDYFMLVNRRCLSTEKQNVTVYIDSAEMAAAKKMWYVIDQYSQDTTFTGAINGAIPFTPHLDPGQGKLFKLVP